MCPRTGAREFEQGGKKKKDNSGWFARLAVGSSLRTQEPPLNLNNVLTTALQERCPRFIDAVWWGFFSFFSSSSYHAGTSDAS